ncbi:MAG: hypothetical protein JNM41_11325 [Flavipsychrobacter sp.]|nr:hypothetical protein [Flavipsychrobacter sp.]
MLNQEMLLKRLALVKLLYKGGLELSQQAGPSACFSILSFHDSIEMFLKLVCQHRNIKSDKFDFIEYWNSIPDLTLKESCNALNERRKNIKHRGLLLDRSEIDSSRVTTKEFFEQNTFKQFGVQFNEVSLLTLVTYPTVRGFLEEASNYLKDEKNQESVGSAAIAFDELLTVYEESKHEGYNSPFFFGKSLEFNSSFFMGVKDREMAGFIDNVKKSIEEMSRAIKIVSMGLDYKRFIKFDILTPHVTKFIGGSRHLSEGWRIKKLTQANCQFCIDFVVDCAIKLQDFDFSIGELFEPQEPHAH